jgi:uncharacterized protein YcnI
MNLITRATLRALTLAAMTATGLSAATATAWAHVEVQADNAVRGGETILTFEVPNESDKGALTTQLSVALPNVASADTEAMPGWTAKLDRDTGSGTTRSVTWTAAPGGGIAPDQFALFRIAVTLPNTDSATFPAAQTYADGTVVHWDQPPLPGGGEPEYPVPTLTLTASPSDNATQSSSPSVSASPAPTPAQASSPPASDITARWLGGSGLIVGALAVGLAVLLLRRRS